MKTLPFVLSVVLCLGLLPLASCGPALAPTGVAILPTDTPTPTETAAPALTPTPPPTATPTATSAPSPTPTPAPPAPDLTSRPLVWFGPLPPLPTGPGRPFIGSADFLELFVADAAWVTAAGRIHVFKLYGEWVAWHSTDAELRQVVSDLTRRGMAIAFEAGPLTQTGECGAGIEGFAGVDEGLRIARRIQAAGGTVSLVAFDHPFDAGTLDTSPNACRWSPAEVAENVARYVRAIRSVFPDAIFGDTETARHDVGEIARWVDAYRAALGEDLAFLHMDLDYARPDWPQSTLEIESFLRSRGIAFGIIYFGGWQDRTDRAWLSNAGERVKSYELAAGGQPDHVIFQSWHDHPDRVLPENEPYTFTWFIDTYFEDKEALGVRTEGPGANLAFGKPVSVSKSLPGFEPERAVDANVDTWWGAGDFAPQWIEVDLGTSYTIVEVNLVVSQDPAGGTRHSMLVKGAGTGGEYVLLHTFNGRTADLAVLSVPLDGPLEGIRFIRIETEDSPSWVSWREIEVIAGGGANP